MNAQNSRVADPLLCAALALVAGPARLAAAAQCRRRRRRPILPCGSRGRAKRRPRQCVGAASISRRSTSGRATSSISAPRVAIQPVGAKEETFGVIFATAAHAGRQASRAPSCSRTSRSRRPTFRRCPNRGAAYSAELQKQHRERRAHDRARPARGVARRRRNQAADGARPEQPAAGDRQLFAGDPGARSTARRSSKPVPDDSRFKRVINTRALILQAGFGDKLLHPRLRRLARGRCA